jgi:formylglycine-generating enzyme required for sulfatase activity
MKRVALFVGVDQYDDPNLPALSFAVSDATRMQGFFRQCAGFDRAEVLANPPNREAILSRIAELSAGLGAGDLFVFSFSGRGIDVRHDRVLLCSGDSLLEAKKDWAGLPLGLLKHRMQGPFRSLFLLDDRRDCVRDETSKDGSVGNGRDIAFAQSIGADIEGERTIVFACKGENTVWEVPSRKVGLFPSALLESLAALRGEGEALEFSDSLLEEVGNRMKRVAKADNLPCKARPEKDGLPIVVAEGTRSREKGSQPHRDSNAPASNPEDRKAGDRLQISLRGVEFVFRWCPPGSFMFGSPRNERGRFWDERPLPLAFVRGFWMGETPVTQDQWQTVMYGENPSRRKGADLPVESVSFGDCHAFLYEANVWVRDNDGPYRFSLPLEIEWEYACRAGSGGLFGGTGTLGEMGWYRDNAAGRTHPVGRKKPNAWGLFDMHGNVQEWCKGCLGDGRSPDHHFVHSNVIPWNPREHTALIPVEAVVPVDDSGSWSFPELGLKGCVDFEKDVHPRSQDNQAALRGGSFNMDARRCRSAFRRIPPQHGRRWLREGSRPLGGIYDSLGTFRAGDIGFRLMAWDFQASRKGRH